MTEQKTLPSQDIAAQSTTDKFIPDRVADRFGISGFRTENKFDNSDGDSSKVNRCSDSPAVMEAFEVFFNAK